MRNIYFDTDATEAWVVLIYNYPERKSRVSPRIIADFGLFVPIRAAFGIFLKGTANVMISIFYQKKLYAL